MSDLARVPAADEEELRKKQAQLKRLEARLAQKELELATLQGELRAFEARYLSALGRLYWELDDLNARIAEANARLHPDQVEVQREAHEARAHADETAEAVGRAKKRAKRQTAEFRPSDDLRTLYRELAKRIHPDLAADDAERARRTELMAAANRAYEDGDDERLRAILREWETSPESVVGEDTRARLDRVALKIDRVRQRLDAIRAEMVELSQSDLYRLKRKVEYAQGAGRDLFREMAAQVRKDIREARKRLNNLSRTLNRNAG